MKLFSYQSLRVLVLLLLLASAAIYTQQQRLASRGWYQPLHVSVFPINADNASETRSYIDNLRAEDFTAIDEFMAREGERYDIVASIPTVMRLGPEVDALPPAPPGPDANVVSIMLWSLRLRWWALWNTPAVQSGTQGVRMFVQYHEAKEGQKLAHSLGLQKGLLGVVHAYATRTQNERNSIVIAHELLHTVGATDKYAPGGEPLFPQGYAQPDLNPLYPQARAEIMAVRIPRSQTSSTMSSSLRLVVVGEQTAREINWIESE